VIGILTNTTRDVIVAAMLQTQNETKVLIDTFVLVWWAAVFVETELGSAEPV